MVLFGCYAVLIASQTRILESAPLKHIHSHGFFSVTLPYYGEKTRLSSHSPRPSHRATTRTTSGNMLVYNDPYAHSDIHVDRDIRACSRHLSTSSRSRSKGCRYHSNPLSIRAQPSLRIARCAALRSTRLQLPLCELPRYLRFRRQVRTLAE
jgi:hypothetical protein